jgi:hypothetical protein
MVGQTRFPITEKGTEQGPSFWMSAVPNYNGRVSQFTFDYSGDADMQTLYVLVNGELTPRHACSFKATFTNGAYQFYLENDSGDGTYMGPVSLSSPNNYNLENSQCRLTEISAAPPSNSFAELVFGVYFKNEAFFGHKTIWTMSQDVNGYSSGWTPVGGLQFCVSWILDLDGVCWGNQKPSAITVSPTSATVYTTEASLLTVKATDPDGWQDVTLLDIAADDEGTDDCHFSFNPISQTFYWNGSSQVVLDLAVNPQGTADNGYCRIGGPGTSIAGDSNSGALILRLPIQFDQGGIKSITVKAYDATHDSPFPYGPCPKGIASARPVTKSIPYLRSHGSSHRVRTHLAARMPRLRSTIPAPRVQNTFRPCWTAAAPV